jgi:hypothetical protein
MSLSATILIELVKLYGTKLTAIISPRHLNINTNMIFQERLKLLKLTKDLGFSYEKIYLFPSRIIIKERYII